jgi:RNA polymerase sigma-70 factor (ECF subfamily)
VSSPVVAPADDLRRLVELAQQGDRDSLESLYLMHFDRIYSYLHMSVGNRHDAEDLTTQTFLKMLEAIGRFRWRSAPFSAWLFRIAHNLAMDHFRATRRWQPEEEVPEPEGAAESSAEEAALASIGRRSMLELIERLSIDQQQVLMLKHRALASLQKQLTQD